MRRREPPPLATWILRHLTAGDPDEAIDGDLFEVFRLGRSDAWYWRQVAAACIHSWYGNLYARGPILVFALIWSLLSPVWYETLERIDTSQNFDKGGQIFGLLWLPLVLIAWIVLHAAFLWAGLLVYQLVHTVLRKPVPYKELRRAFWIVPLILPLAHGAIFLLANLYWYSLPGLSRAHLAPTILGKIADLGILPNLIRIPYFVTMVIALWETVHRIRRDENPLFANSTPDWTPTEPNAVAISLLSDPTRVKRFFAFMVAIGLVNSMIAAVFLCRLPDSHSVDLGSLLGNAIMFVAIGALGGITGSWLYWISPASPLREGSPVPFSLFALTCTTGWVWVPAMMLFAEQVSATMAFVAMVGAFILSKGLRSTTYFVFFPAQPLTPRWEQGDLFAESLSQPPFEVHGYVIALSLFAAAAALASRSNYTAALLLAMSAFIFAWMNTVPRREAFERDVQIKRAVRRVATTTVPAILLTMWALLDGLAYRNREIAQASAAVNTEAHASSTEQAKTKAPPSTTGTGGFESVVLWPNPEKKEIVPPIAVDDSLLDSGSKRPLIIRFDGPYWILQPPSNRPGPEAHVAHGTPTSEDVESNNAVELVMNAHQKLARPIPIARCREIDVGIENRDNKAGLVSLGVLLTDEASSPKRTVYLGQQPVQSTEPGHFLVKKTPTYDTVRFSVPSNAPLHKFNEITVMFLPDIEHAFVAPKIAIQQFELLPR